MDFKLIQDIQEECQEVFRLVEELKPSLNTSIMVAGGYLRDRLLGKEPNDIDVYVTSWMKIKSLGLEENADYENQDSRGCLNTGINFNGHEITLVHKLEQSHFRIIKNHPLPLSDVFCYKGTIQIHPTFTNAVSTKKMKVNDTGQDIDVLTNYVNKIQKKFPEYEIELSPRLKYQSLFE